MKVAFIITVYKNDKLEYFKEAIGSIINQDCGFENINIYLGIDGNLPDDIQGYIDENKNIFYKIIQNETNKGLAYTLNKLIDILEDEKYIFRMDSDDICKLDRVSKQIDYMEQNQDIEIIGGAIEEIDENKKVKMIRTYPKNIEEAKEYICKASIFAHPTVCFRKSFFDKGFRYSREYRFNQDLALWYEALINNIQIDNIDDIILSLRTSNDFYQRRNYKRAFTEFKIYWKGINKLYGFSYRVFYPFARLIIRLMPSKVIKILYSKKFRNILNK